MPGLQPTVVELVHLDPVHPLVMHPPVHPDGCPLEVRGGGVGGNELLAVHAVVAGHVFQVTCKTGNASSSAIACTLKPAGGRLTWRLVELLFQPVVLGAVLGQVGLPAVEPV